MQRQKEMKRIQIGLGKGEGGVSWQNVIIVDPYATGWWIGPTRECVVF